MSSTSKESNSDIQWERSKGNDSKQSWIASHSIEVSFALTLLSGVIFEYLFSIGTTAMSVTVFILLVLNFGAKRHDNVPMVRYFYPIIGHWRFGDIRFYYTIFYDLEVEMFNEYSQKDNNGEPVPLLTLAVPGRRVILMTDPELIDLVYRKQFGNAIKDPSQYEVIEPLLGNGIFASNGRVWKVELLFLIVVVVCVGLNACYSSFCNFSLFCFFSSSLPFLYFCFSEIQVLVR